MVKRLKCCSNCLATSHVIKNCKSIHVCKLCKQKHHSLLHRDVESSGHTGNKHQLPTAAGVSEPGSLKITLNQNPFNAKSPNSTTTQNLQMCSAHLNANPNHTVVLGSVNIVVHVGEKNCATRAFVDPGSQSTFVSRRLQRKLALPTFSVPSMKVTGIMDGLTGKSSTMCILTVGSPIDPEFQLKICAYVVEKITDQLPSCSNLEESSNFPDDFTVTDVTRTPVDILLGGNVYPKILTTDVKIHPAGNLIAQRTIFGWIVTGEVCPSRPVYPVSSVCTHVGLNDQLAHSRELEEVRTVIRTPANRTYCKKRYRNTNYRNPN